MGEVYASIDYETAWEIHKTRVCIYREGFLLSFETLASARAGNLSCARQDFGIK